MKSGELLLHLPEGWKGIDDELQRQGHTAPSSLHALELHVAIGTDASYKIGTCQHCVLVERGRPDRAWDADGDHDLDFDRDTYFAFLATLGIVTSDRQAYVCP